MCRLLETIRVYKGKPDNLEAHEARIDRAQKSLFNKRSLPALSQLFKEIHVPDAALYRWRIIYTQEVQTMELIPHQHPTVHQFQLVYLSDTDYAHKYENRTFLLNIKNSLAPTTEAILVVNGWITDTTISNLVFEKHGIWYTPDYPLLAGTRRAQLLSDDRIVATPIREEDLKKYNKIRMINALMTWEDCIELPIDSISGPASLK